MQCKNFIVHLTRILIVILSDGGGFYIINGGLIVDYHWVFSSMWHKEEGQVLSDSNVALVLMKLRKDGHIQE